MSNTNFWFKEVSNIRY